MFQDVLVQWTSGMQDGHSPKLHLCLKVANLWYRASSGISHSFLLTSMPCYTPLPQASINQACNWYRHGFFLLFNSSSLHLVLPVFCSTHRPHHFANFPHVSGCQNPSRNPECLDLAPSDLAMSPKVLKSPQISGNKTQPLKLGVFFIATPILVDFPL